MNHKQILLITTGIIATEIIWYAWKRYRHLLFPISPNYRQTSEAKTKVSEESNSVISEVMFFSANSSFCRAHAPTKIPCSKPNCPVSYLRKMMDYITSAQSTIDLCMYFFTSQELANAVINVSNHGVDIRIILDATMADNNETQANLFHKKGIKLRMKRFDGCMHHKFAVIDKRILITGSSNWTMKAFFGNYDNVLVTNQQSLVHPFITEFDQLWTDFGAIA